MYGCARTSEPRCRAATSAIVVASSRWWTTTDAPTITRATLASRRGVGAVHGGQEVEQVCADGRRLRRGRLGQLGNRALDTPGDRDVPLPAGVCDRDAHDPPVHA